MSGAINTCGKTPRANNASAAFEAGARPRYAEEIDMELIYSDESDNDPDSNASPPASGVPETGTEEPG